MKLLVGLIGLTLLAYLGLFTFAETLGLTEFFPALMERSNKWPTQVLAVFVFGAIYLVGRKKSAKRKTDRDHDLDSNENTGHSE